MTEDIKQTVGQTVNNAVNSAVDSGSEAIRNGLNSVFGSQNQEHIRIRQKNLKNGADGNANKRNKKTGK